MPHRSGFQILPVIAMTLALLTACTGKTNSLSVEGGANLSKRYSQLELATQRLNAKYEAASEACGLSTELELLQRDQKLLNGSALLAKEYTENLARHDASDLRRFKENGKKFIKDELLSSPFERLRPETRTNADVKEAENARMQFFSALTAFFSNFPDP